MGKTALRTYGIFLAASLTVLFLDQGSKLLVLGYLTGQVTLIPNFFHLQCIFNGGAAWNLFNGHRFLLILFAITTLLGGFLFRHQLGMKDRRIQFSLGLITGGIIGNLVDRTRLGVVIDSIDIQLPFYRWPTFNVADCALCLGFLLYLFFSHRSTS
jgi:signal peptidase II